MGRREYQHVVLRCNRGINQQTDLAQPDECADALNVWAPDGVVKQRPGYEGVFSLAMGSQGITTQSQVYIKYDGSSYANAAEGETLTLNSLDAGDLWYIGLDEVSSLGSSNDYETVLGVTVLVSNTNSNSIHYKAEYYNGTEWKYLKVTEHGSISTGKPTTHLGSTTSSTFTWVTPGDWATTTVNSQTKYFIRFTLLNAGSAALDSSVSLNNSASTTWRVSQRSSDHMGCRGLFSVQFPKTKRYINVFNRASATYNSIGTTLDFEDLNESAIRNYTDESLATVAPVPQFGEAFVAYGGDVTVHDQDKNYPVVVGGGGHLADIEDADFAVGDFAPYDPDLVVGLDEFPRARYICFFKGRLWCAGIIDDEFTVRWSAAAPYHKIFSVLAAEPLVEDDNSVITALHPFGENVTVFKGDSVWQMIATGPNPATQVEHFSPIKVVDGVGCVAHASIQNIQGNLLFLAEDGVYAYNGTPSVQKISDRVTDVIKSITPGKRHMATSVNWKSRGIYLLSFSTDGSWYNNKTLVYDYINNAWWVWDIPARIWLRDEDVFDNEIIYFVNQHDQVFRMNEGNHDHGSAISSHVLTQRIGEKDNVRLTVRQVEILSDKLTRNLTVAVRSNDDEANESSGALALTESTDAVYGTAVDTVDSYVVNRRKPRRLSFRKQGDWVQVKVSHSEKNAPMVIGGIDIGIGGGARR